MKFESFRDFPSQSHKSSPATRPGDLVARRCGNLYLYCKLSRSGMQTSGMPVPVFWAPARPQEGADRDLLCNGARRAARNLSVVAGGDA